MQTKQRFSVSAGHLGVIALTAAVLILFSIIQNGFRFSFSGASTKTSQVLGQVSAQAGDEAPARGSQNSGSDSGNLADQLALIDPGLNQGAVLGASTDLAAEIPDARTLYTPQQLAQIKVKLSLDSSRAAVKRYLSQAELAENYYNATANFGALNSDDQESLKSAGNGFQALAREFSALEAPANLAEYHRLKIMYYVLLSDTAKSYLTGGSDPKGGYYGLAVFSMMSRLESLRQQIEKSYNLSL